jgi:hypothetical protein
MYQIVNSDGSFELAENGVDIADFTVYGTVDYEYRPTSFTTVQNDLGQICVAWSSISGIVARSRIIDSDGSLLGSETGQEIYPLQSAGEASELSISSYNNEFYVSWIAIDYIENTRTVYSSKTTNSTEWGEATFVDTYNGSQYYSYQLIKVTSNYTIIQQNNVMCQVFKTNNNGTVSEIDQVLISYNYKFDCDADNNLFFTWNDVGKIYLQGITDSNDLYWNNPVQVSYHVENQDIVRASAPEILISDGINIIWSQTANSLDYELRAQKLSYSGEKMWDEQGILLTSMQAEYLEYGTLLKEVSAGYIVAGWIDYYGMDSSYKLKLINSDGLVVLDENSLVLTASNIRINNLQVTNLPSNKILCVWDQDFQNISGLYAQVVDFTAVDNESNDITPMAMNLLQNYPNPFNPETNISFQVPNSGQVRLDIYNIKGQKVKTLVNDRFSAGRHSVVWNGKDDSNKQVASGLYLYKMISGKYKATSKMILMK